MERDRQRDVQAIEECNPAPGLWKKAAFDMEETPAKGLRDYLRSQAPVLATLVEALWLKSKPLHDLQNRPDSSENGRSHVEKVESNIWRLLTETRGRDGRLNLDNVEPRDVFLLSAAACCHDFAKALKRGHPLSAPFKHGEASAGFVRENAEILGIGKHEAEEVAVAIGIQDFMAGEFKERLLGLSTGARNPDGPINFRRVAVLLKAADILHCDSSRNQSFGGDPVKLGEDEDDEVNRKWVRSLYVARMCTRGWSVDGTRICIQAEPDNAEELKAFSAAFEYMSTFEWVAVADELEHMGFPHRLALHEDTARWVQPPRDDEARAKLAPHLDGSGEEPPLSSSSSTTGGESPDNHVMRVLDDAWRDPDVHVVSIVGPTGSGRADAVSNWYTRLSAGLSTKEQPRVHRIFMQGHTLGVTELITDLLHLYVGEELEELAATTIPRDYREHLADAIGRKAEVIVLFLDQTPSQFSGETHDWAELLEVIKLYADTERRALCIVINRQPLEELVGHRACRVVEIDEDSRRVEPTIVLRREALPTHPDEPAVKDLLGRKAFAEALGERLRYIRKANEESGENSPFLMNLDGAWGTGKSSILNFLKQDLQRETGESSTPPWIVIEINAWRNQDSGPSWFTLMDAVFRQSRKQLWKHNKWRAIRLCDREYSWRFLERWILRFLTVVPILVAVFWFQRWMTADASPNLKSIADWMTAFAAFGGILVLILTRTRALLPGSARVAEEFVKAQSDPSQKLANHFNDLAKWIARPVVIFIDDLDRCRAAYVVELLETIQTLYRQAPVFYVVAADRNWLCRSFEMVYEGYQGSVDTPGRPLGHLFVEKLFQLSAAVPPLDDRTRDVFWKQLIDSGASPVPKLTDQLQKEADDDVSAAQSEEEILAILEAPAESREELEARRRAAAIHLASPKIAATIGHALNRFASLVESNPRFMKRLINAYGVQRTIAILRGITAPSGELALWTILQLRWPQLADHIELHPEVIDLILAGEPAEVFPDVLTALATDPAVLRVLRGDGVDESLTTDSVCRILNPSTSEGTAT